ncbi:MAG: hypothetical protein ABIP17_09640 [Ilumatobacteraceae bacterium]
MASSVLTTGKRARQHGAVLAPSDRRELERGGWRTTLDYRENHVRGLDGRLLRVEPVWTAEAERFDGPLVVASAVGASEAAAWSQLRAEIDAERVTTRRTLRLAPLR